jgi:hypothetical protein
MYISYKIDDFKKIIVELMKNGWGLHQTGDFVGGWSISKWEGNVLYLSQTVDADLVYELEKDGIIERELIKGSMMDRAILVINKRKDVIRTNEEIITKIANIIAKQQEYMIEMKDFDWSRYVDVDNLEELKALNETKQILIDYLLYDSVPNNEDIDDDWCTKSVLPWLFGETEILVICCSTL